MLRLHTIRKKVLFSSLSLLLVIIVQLVFTSQSVSNVKEGFAKIADNDVKLLVLSKDIQFSVAQVQQWLTDISATRGLDGLNDGFDEAAKHAANFRSYIQQITRLDTANTAKYQEMSSAFEKYYSTGQQMAKTYVKDGPAEGNKEMGAFDKAAATLIEKVSALLDTVSLRVKHNMGEELGEIDNLQSTAWISSVLVLVFLSILFYIVKKNISSIDELGVAIWQIAGDDGDLTRRVNISGKDEIAHVGDGLNQFITAIRSMVISIAETSSKLSGNAETSSGVMAKTSQDVTSQKDGITQLASAVSQISAIGIQTADKAVAATSAAVNAKQAADTGQKTVSDVVESINTLESEIQTASHVIERLDKNTDEIGNVLNVIKGIAEQTNLLALNAAIEAARAGEQGRGFAVVADEVRSLANRTQESTAEIQRTIEQLQKGAKEAIHVIESSSDIAVKTVEKVNHAKDQLQSIVNDIEIINTVNRHIAESTTQQNNMVATVNHNIERISHVADQTAEGALTTATASEDLLQLANKLCFIVQQFKV